MSTNMNFYEHLMLEHTSVGIALYDAQDFRLVTANQTYLAIIGRYLKLSHHKEAIGQCFIDWLPKGEANMHAAIFHKVVETGIPHQIEEYPFRAAEADVTYWKCSLKPVGDTAGSITHLVHTMSEVTAEVLRRQQAEQVRDAVNRTNRVVEHEHMQLRAILDQMPEGILITELSNGAISYANAAAAHIFDIPLSDLINIPLHKHPRPQRELDGSREAVPWHFPVIRALCGETVTGQETLVPRPDGSTVVTLMSSAPLRTQSGVMTGAVIVFQDITPQKSLEQHKKEFLSITSHELRTPITTIQGLAEILQLHLAQGMPLNSPRISRALSRITEQSQHLTHLIEEMLDLSRIEQEQFALKYAEHNLLSVLGHVVESHAATTNQHNFHLVLQDVENTETLIGRFDEERVMQVMNNLISNAIKYSPAGGEIEVGLRYAPQGPDEVLIWVKDAGIGIAAKELSQIFDRFHRASALDRSISGLGIGLYLAKEIVTRHNGRIWVESTEGSGSTFYVILPLV